MARNLVVCCDGTSNEFGPNNTNVVRLAQALERVRPEQSVYYDPGIGTLPEPGFGTKIGKKVSGALNLAFATGLSGKVEAAYTHLMNAWEPGDDIFLFGFSRGAYTVRVLAALLHNLGLLPAGNENLVPYLMRLFGGIRGAAKQGAPSAARSKYWDLCDEFRTTFARPVANAVDRRFPIHFIGVWDTVSSVGWAWEPESYPFTRRNPSVRSVRHAVAIDERRAFFRQNLFGPVDGQDLVEVWFPGVHADVGGGYARAEGGLWRGPLEWMIGQARDKGLGVNDAALDALLSGPDRTVEPWRDAAHDSLRWYWWPAEIFPKLPGGSTSPFRLPKFNLASPRQVPPGALIHQSALRRIREIDYAPRNLSERFIAQVRALQAVPLTMPCQP